MKWSVDKIFFPESKSTSTFCILRSWIYPRIYTLSTYSRRCKSVPRISHLDTSSSQSGFPPTCFQRWPRHLQWWPSYFPPAVSSRMPHLVTFHTFDLPLPIVISLCHSYSLKAIWALCPQHFTVVFIQCPSPFLETKWWFAKPEI